MLCICHDDINQYPFEIVKTIRFWIVNGEEKEKMPFYVLGMKKMKLWFIENHVSIKGRELSVMEFHW